MTLSTFWLPDSPQDSSEFSISSETLYPQCNGFCLSSSWKQCSVSFIFDQRREFDVLFDIWEQVFHISLMKYILEVSTLRIRDLENSYKNSGQRHLYKAHTYWLESMGQKQPYFYHHFLSCEELGFLFPHKLKLSSEWMNEVLLLHFISK